MPILNPDLSEAQDFKPITEGTYPARITACGTQNTKDKGLPMIVPEFAVTVDGKERKRKAFLLISGEASFGFGQLLRACHMDALADAYSDKTGTVAKPPFDTDSLVGQQLQVNIVQEIRKDAGHEGEVSDRIKNFLKQ